MVNMVNILVETVGESNVLRVSKYSFPSKKSNPSVFFFLIGALANYYHVLNRWWGLVQKFTNRSAMCDEVLFLNFLPQILQAMPDDWSSS